MTVYRLHRAEHLAADYTGAMLAGGRWNPIGTPMLYTAEHLSLACLEVFVHLKKTELPRDYVWSKVKLPGIPDVLVSVVPYSVSTCQVEGATWMREAGQVASRVPSVIIPEEYSVLLNPRHEFYRELSWSDPRPFQFDPRLFVSEPKVL